MPKTSEFLTVLREEILQPRFDALLQYGEDYVLRNFDTKSQRMCWYRTVNLFKAKTGKKEPDLSGSALEQYGKFLKAIRGFCEGKKNVELAKDVNPAFEKYWGLLRKALNIEAKGRAVAHGAAGDNIMVVPENKEQYINKGLLCVICEKETVGKLFLDEMNQRGWEGKIIIIITQGFSSCEVIETLMEIANEVEKGNTEFYVGVLHDHDIAGTLIIEDIKKFYPVIDLGINFDMLDSIDPNIWENEKEDTSYTNEQIVSLQNLGLQAIWDRMQYYRLELDNLAEVSPNKIVDFCDFAETQLSSVADKWDLNRVCSHSVSYPSEVYRMKRQVEQLWDKLVLAATGKRFWDLDWDSCIEEKMNEFIEKNRHYSATLEEVKKCDEIVDAQSRELQQIINTDADNVEIIKKIKNFVDQLKIDEIEELIKNMEGNDDSNEDNDENEEEDEDDGITIIDDSEDDQEDEDL